MSSFAEWSNNKKKKTTSSSATSSGTAKGLSFGEWSDKKHGITREEYPASARVFNYGSTNKEDDEKKSSSAKKTATSNLGNNGMGGTFLGGWKQPEAKEKKTPTAAEIAAQQKEAEEAAKRLSYLESLDLNEQQKKIDALTAESKKGAKLNIHAFGAYDSKNMTETEVALAEAQEDYNLARDLQYRKKGDAALANLDSDTLNLVSTVAKYNTEARWMRSSEMPTETERESALKSLLAKGLTMEEIEQFADYRARQLNEQEYDAKVKEIEELANNENILGISDMGAILASLKSIPLNLGSGAGYLDLLMQKAHNKQMGYDRPLDYKTGAMSLYGQASAARETVSQNIVENAETELGGQVGSFLYQTGMSMADSAVVAGLGALGIGATGTLLLGGSAATSAAVDAKNRGGSDSQALWSGAFAGAAETVFEKVSVENLLEGKFTKNFVGSEFKKLLADIGTQGLVEGSEELFTAFANHITDRAIMGGSSTYAKAIREYMAAGMTASEAKAKATADFAAECATSFVGGMLSGGVMGGVVSVGKSSFGSQSAYNRVQPAAGENTQLTLEPLSEASTGKEMVRTFAAAKGGEYGAALVSSYNEEQDADTYLSDMDKVYIAGRNNAPLDRVKTDSLTDQQRQYVYNVGNKEYVRENAKEDLTNEEVYLRGGSERLDGTSASGAVRGVEESTGRAAQWQAQTVQSADAGAGTLSYGEEVTVASLGIAGGSSIAKVRKVTGGSTPELAKAQAMADEYGLQLVAFGGGNLVINQEEVRACIIGKRMFVRVDHQSFTSAQLTSHEVTHHRIDSGEIDPKAVRAQMEATHTAEAMAAVDKLYADAYAGTGLKPEEIWVEVVCDSQGDMNIFAKTDKKALVGEFLSETKAAANTTAKKANPIRGPTEAKMSRETNFTEDKYFARQIDRFESLTEGGYITVGVISAGSPLNKVGIPSGKLYFDVSKIRQEMETRKDPVSADVMKRIPSVLNHPIVMTEFTDKNGDVSVNVYGELFIGSAPVVVGVMITKTARGVVVNKVQTVHPKGNFMSDMTDDKILYLSENKKETKRWFQALGTQKLPLGGTKFGFIRSLSQKGNSVKTKLSRELDQTVAKAGAQYDAETESVAPMNFSRETWVQSSYMTDRDKAAKSIAKALGVTEKQAKAYINDINSIAKMIADDRVRLDYESSQGRSSFVKNAEYGGSIDFSTLCKKRRLFTGTFSAIQRALPNTALTAEEILEIRSMMIDKGLEATCGLCYVEGSRANMGAYTKEFLRQYAETIPKYLPNMAEMNTADGQEWLRINHPEVYEAYEYFMNHYGRLDPSRKALFASQQKPKMYSLRTAYKGEILDEFEKSGAKVDAKNKNGGLRIQSFSDFEIVHLIDMMQVIMDMSRVGLAGQAYTKVPEFAQALGGTGLKINLSLIAKGVDANGNLVFDDREGMPHQTAFDLRNQYSKNVGTIIVVFNNEQLLAAMADPRIDFIIPFHRSQWKSELYSAMGLPAGTVDYTNQQSESYIEPVFRESKTGKQVKLRPDNYMPNQYWDFSKSGKENAEAYLKMCAANNRRPKFSKLLKNNGDGSYSLKADGSTDGYWKLLIDFKMYDNNGVGSPQMPVKPTFNMEESRRMLDEYTGGHSSFPVANDVVDEFVAKYKKQHKGAKFSREVDSTGRQLSEAQAEFFKDSKVRDENGNLLVMYHGTNTPNFTVFDPQFSDDKRSLFFTSSPNIADSYTTVQTGGRNIDPYRLPHTIKTLDEYNQYMKSVGSDSRIVQVTDELIEKAQQDAEAAIRKDKHNDFYRSKVDELGVLKGKYIHYNGGLSYITRRDMAFDTAEELIEKDVTDKYWVTHRFGSRYAVYLNMTNPYVMDAGKHYRGVGSVEIKNGYDDTTATITLGDDEFVVRRGYKESYEDFASRVLPPDGAKKFLQAIEDEREKFIQEEVALGEQTREEVIAFWEKYGGVEAGEFTFTADDISIDYTEPGNWNDLYGADVSVYFDWDESYPFKTRDVAQYAKENDYDGVIFKNLKDIGGYSGGTVTEASTIAIAFDSNQVKATNNLNPTSDPDIRYSRELDQEKVDKAWQNFIDKYGEIPAGENPFRQVHVPKKTGDDENVSQTIRTVMEARATPDEAIPTIKEMVANGDFSYESITDEASLGRAMAEVKSKGWETALKDWTASVRAGNVSKDNTAMGWALYNNAANSGNIKQAVEILQDMVQHQRSAAQALQATRILKRLSPDGQLYGVTRSVQNLQEELIARHGDKAPDLKIDETLAQKVLTAGTQEERDEAMKEIYRDIGRQMPSTFVDKWNAWRYLAMLGNLRTHVRNVVGNAGFAPVVGVKNLVGAGIESVVSKASGGKIDRTKAAVGLSKKDRELLAAAWKDFKNVQESAEGGGKYSEFANANKHIEEGRTVFKFKPLEAARRGNSKLLDVEDMWFSQPHYASALAQYCKARGISAAQIEKGTPAARKARAYAIEEAKKATYRDTNALSSFLSKRFSESGDAKSVAKAANTLIAGILPFRKTPANILARGIEYSPIGLANGIKKAVWDVQRGKSTAAEAIDNISSGLTGTGLLGLGLYLAAQGLVRGAGGGDEKERTFEELMGHQAYALELPNGTSITLDWLAPEALPFFVGVNLYEQTQGDFSDMKMDDALSAIGRVTEPMLEMSCLQSLNSLLDAVGYASEEGLGVVAADAVTSYLTQALPTLLGQLERSTEKSRMTTYTDKNKWLSTDLQYTVGRATARIPLLEYGQIPYIDAWGREEDSGSAAARVFNNFVNPAYTSTVEEDYLSDELLRLYRSTGESVLPSRASKYFNVDGERKDLTADEYVQYATVRGQTAYDMLYELASDKVYKQLSDMDKVGVVKDVYELANAMAKTEVSSYKPDGWVAKALDGESSGVSAADYILYRAALDKVNADGGTPTNAEQEEAIRAMGLDDEANHFLWMAYHTSDKNEPNW